TCKPSTRCRLSHLVTVNSHGKNHSQEATPQVQRSQPSPAIVGGGAKKDRKRPALVAPRHRAQRRAYPRPGRLLSARPQADRSFIEAIGGTEQASQGRSIPLGALDADLLHQPCRPEPAGVAQKNVDACERRAAQAIRQSLISP